MSALEHVPLTERDTYSIIPQAYDLAEKLSKTEFVPSGLRGKPEAVMAAMLQGHEVGLPPMMSLAKIAVINGTPSMAAEAMRALVLSHGHEIWFEEKNTTKVTICGQRRGSERVSRVTWTMDDAKRAGLAGKPGWRAYPRAYLTARATSELCRDVFADVLGGISYTPEEVEDIGDDYLPDPAGATDLEGEPPVIPAPTKTRKAVTKKTAAKPTPPPVTPPPPPLATPPLPGEPGYDNILDLPADFVSEAKASVALDGDTQSADTGGIDLTATLEQAGIPAAKFLRQARLTATDRGRQKPTAVEQIGNDLVAATLDDLRIAPIYTGTTAPTDGRNSKMWAMVAEAWPDATTDQGDRLRQALIRIVTSGRTASSKDMDDAEWSDLYVALDSITEQVVELVDTEADGWTLLPPKGD